MSWPTTRRYPRSMKEAWPAEHCNPIEVYRRPGRISSVLLAIFVGCVLAYALALWVEQQGG